MTDQDVIDLYRCLLGRAPENANTIAAFRHYYPDFATGRRAVLRSEEFKLYAARVTGEAVPPPAVAAPLALALLQSLPAGAPVRQGAASDPELRRGFALQMGRLEAARLAVVLGDAGDLALADLAPLGTADAAVLHIPAAAAALSAAILESGPVLLTLPLTAGALCDLLGAQEQRIDALFLLGAPADAAAVRALARLLAPRALVAVRDASGQDDAGLVRAVCETGLCETALAWRGFSLHHRGGWLLPVTYAPAAAQAFGRAAYPSLAVAAIVRDEAACVENMLRSTLPFASFHAVLDTGSSDDTQAVVQAFMAASGVPSVFSQAHHTQFGDSFADMRNAALALVPDWVEWVLMLDADEEMVPEDAQALLALTAGAAHDAFMLPRYNYRGHDKSGEVEPYPDRQARLLRHGAGPRPRYTGAVHETIRGTVLGQPPLDAVAIGGPRGGPHIHHLVRRFRDTAAEEKKQAFYRDIASRHAPA